MAKVLPSSDAYFNRIQRYTVLYPLVGHDHTEKNRRSLVGDLVKLRQKRFGELSAMDVALPHRFANRWTQYCQPSFSGGKVTRTCGMDHFCPFCYGRWVADTWSRLDNFFTEHNHGYDLVIRCHQKLLPYKSVGFANATTWLDHVLRDFADVRGLIVKKVQPVGAMLFTSIWPSRKGWVTQQRMLAVVEAAQQLPHGIEEKTKGFLHRYSDVDRRVLFNAVAKTCKYPTKLMYSADVQRVALLLSRRASTRTRMSARFGQMRG